MLSLHGIIKEHEKCEDPSSRIFFTMNPNAKNMHIEKSDTFHTKIDKELFYARGKDLILNQWCHSSEIESKYQTNTTLRSY